MRASKVVKGDLIRYGLLLSENKCMWGARRTLEWTCFIFDTVEFRLTVPEWKLSKALGVVQSLLDRRLLLVPTKELASVAGLLGSFRLAMGAGTRFHTRRMLTKLVKVTERFS